MCWVVLHHENHGMCWVVLHHENHAMCWVVLHHENHVIGDYFAHLGQLSTARRRDGFDGTASLAAG